MKSGRFVFFETLRRSDWPLVAWYRMRGAQIHVFDFTYQLKKFGWLRSLIHREEVHRIYVHHASRADGLAIDAAQTLYPQVASHPLIRCLARLYTDCEVEPVVQHALTLNIFRYFYAREYLRRFRESQPSARISFIPETAQEWEGLLRRSRAPESPFLSEFHLPWFPKLWKRWFHQRTKEGYYFSVYLKLTASLLGAALGRLRRALSPRTEPNGKATYAFSISSSFMTQFSGARCFDFLLDHERITKANSVFVVTQEGDGPWTQKARQEGYRILWQSDFSSLKGLWNFPPLAMPLGKAFWALAACINHLRAADWLHQAAAAGLEVYLKEFSLYERIRMRDYIYTNQYWLTPRWRNALIRQLGGESWWYAYSTGGGYTREEGGPFASDGDFGGRHRFWSFENADHFVAPCKPFMDYHHRHPRHLGASHDIGNLWSQAVLETQGALNRSKVLQEWFAVPVEGKKVVAWFDSSFVEAPNSPSSFREGILWYADLLRLTDEDPRLLMLIKPSKEAAYYVADDPGQQWSYPRVGKRLLQVWAALAAHPRVRFLHRGTDPTLVIALSDLTITFPYTSVSADALGARKKGIWYEPGERWRNTLYARKSDLVAHGYQELRGLVEKLLWRVGDEEYADCLDGVIRELIDSFLDGQAITRFRALLARERLIPLKKELLVSS